ncbi:hypothetical protein [Colwellia psychrerythraea]|uniref:Transmembrane anchor protein n=1 Tax=Colwellia psychrerythraea TaxID=28229 RepID=A0A099KL59_COLPS|nr:hypothetical protein [Colwellia psychrerythraea]KGJ90995.1 hypothetical protein GAB14E_0659 [Colwellia psychrerythraea]
METNQKSRSLLKATVISLVIAIVVLVLFILPAEYNIDPTGVGEKLGLTVFNNEAKPVDTAVSKQGQQDSVILIVPAGKGIEYKLAMKQYSKATYEWTTESGELYVDLHGEPKGDTTGYFESYTIATANEMKGSFTAPFEGSHGWYWKNKSNKDIQVQLIFNGEYAIEGLK